MKKIFVILVLMSIAIFITGGDLMALEVKSAAFEEGGSIPPKYTGKGEDISPPLEWSDIPQGTKSLALICDDPDAPMMTWIHWIVYNIPPEADGFKEGMAKDSMLADGTMQGITDFRSIGYGGPSPPPGGAHRYYFKLYALDTKLDLKPGATKKALLKAMEAHILGETQLMGKFKR